MSEANENGMDIDKTDDEKCEDINKTESKNQGTYHSETATPAVPTSTSSPEASLPQRALTAADVESILGQEKSSKINADEKENDKVIKEEISAGPSTSNVAATDNENSTEGDNSLNTVNFTKVSYFLVILLR